MASVKYYHHYSANGIKNKISIQSIQSYFLSISRYVCSTLVKTFYKIPPQYTPRQETLCCKEQNNTAPHFIEKYPHQNKQINKHIHPHPKRQLFQPFKLLSNNHLKKKNITSIDNYISIN